MTAITELLVDVLGVDAAEVEPDAMLVDDLGADSLDLVELQFTVEDRFGVEIPDDAMTMAMTVADLERLAAAAA